VVSNLQGEVTSFDPRTRTWRRLPSVPLRQWAQLFVVPGGLIAVEDLDMVESGPLRMSRYDRRTNTWTPAEDTPLSSRETTGGTPFAGRIYFQGTPSRKHVTGWVGGAYDIATGRWSQDRLTCEWAGDAGATPNLRVMIERWRYDPTNGTCPRLPRAPSRPAYGGIISRESPAEAWTGTALIFWSGGTGGDGVPPPNDGVIFRPSRR
jgi:hypothetical protein